MPDYRSTGVNLLEGSSPKKDGFRFPAEWEKHECTIMVLPSPQNWKGHGFSMDEVHDQWAAIANKLAEFEPVVMVTRPEDRRKALRLVSKQVDLLEMTVNDGWARDTGPMFVVNTNGERRVAGCTFNGWGGKFPPYTDDAFLKAKLSKHFDAAMYPIDLVLEGGAVAFDGEGTVLTTEQCLLHDSRRGSRTRANIEDKLNESFGTSKVIWLDKGLNRTRLRMVT